MTLSGNNKLIETVTTEQLRELERRITGINHQIRQITNSSQTSEEAVVIPPMVNFADNTDFIFPESSYNSDGTPYLEWDNVLANWYVREQSEADSWEQNISGTEAINDSIRNSSHGSGFRSGAIWDDSEGTVKLTGGYVLGSILKIKHAFAGNYMVVRCQISSVPELSISPNIKLRASIYDNTDNTIIKGSIPSLSLDRINHTGSETITREYILEIQMPDGRKFYSNTTSPDSISNTESPILVNNTKAVSISWETVIGASRYRLYRRTPSETDTNWYLISTITNGSLSVFDFGGTNTNIWNVPSFTQDDNEFQYGQGFYDNVGELLQSENEVREISIAIQVPFNFIPNGDQFIQIEFLKEDYSSSDSDDIPSYGLRIDRVGLSYTNGRWTASARDLNVVASPITPNPPPTGGGVGDNPPAGGGSDTCVEEHTMILMWSNSEKHYWIQAKDVVYGDKVVSWDFINKRLAPSKVTKIITGTSISNYRIHTSDNEVETSFSHRYIEDWDDFESGTVVKYIEDAILGFDGTTIIEKNIIAKELLNNVIKVRTWNLYPYRNYISGGLLSHNEKPMFGEVGGNT